MRLMSVAMTADAVVDGTKDVTRRLGWLFLNEGGRLQLCRKVQGRRKGEPLDRLRAVEVVSIRREPLGLLDRDDQPGTYARLEVDREGFPDLSPREFVRRFFMEAQGCSWSTVVTRIEWAYLCSECEHPDAAERVEAHGLCSSCLHHALRSGWEPPM